MKPIAGTEDDLSRYGPPHRALERVTIPTGSPGLRLRFYRGVRNDVRATLKNFARWLRREVRFRHPVHVTIVPQATVVGHGGAAGWAVFLIPPADYSPGDVVRIVLGAGKAAVLQTHYRFPPADSLLRLVHDLAHEVVHYEQWRDGRAVTERGVNRRAAALVNRYLASSPPPPPPPPAARQ